MKDARRFPSQFWGARISRDSQESTHEGGRVERLGAIGHGVALGVGIVRRLRVVVVVLVMLAAVLVCRGGRRLSERRGAGKQCKAGEENTFHGGPC